MKQSIRSLLFTGGLLLGSCTVSSIAQAQGFYVDADLGVSFAEDIKLKRFLTPTPGTELELDPGSSLRISGGYNFNHYVGVGLESGLIFNTAKDNDDIALGHVPIMANVVFRYDKPDCRWVPFIGAGAGADVSVLTLDDVRAPNGAVVDGAASSVDFGWQAFAGLRYRFNDTMAIGGVYKYYYADGASWDVENSAGDIETGTARVHSFGVEFNIQF